MKQVELCDLEIYASASVVSVGAGDSPTGRRGSRWTRRPDQKVRMQSKRRRPKPTRQPAKKPGQLARDGQGFYKADGTLDGTGTKVIAISVPPRELDLIDQMAARAQMSRSHFLRQAAKHFGAKLFPEGFK